MRGKTNLACLYCGGGLTAKKGSVKEHHFAHTGETCKPVVQMYLCIPTRELLLGVYQVRLPVLTPFTPASGIDG
ncbi:MULTISPECIES: hypothetical protein [unclassified Microcoleus]|uniref:hypothetical protein n=1 Tax=unclassified Microcoleus TaxID=2642155 RepID=UPI00404096A0